MTRLGQKQLELLLSMASPALILLTPGKTAQSLLKRGLLSKYGGGDAVRITPVGMRVLADAYQAGQLDCLMRSDPPAPEQRGRPS